MTDRSTNAHIAKLVGIRPAQAAAAIDLLDADNTIPFIARYRKEATGGLDEEQLRQLGETLTYQRKLAERKEVVLRTIEEQKKLTPELSRAIHAAGTLQALEDLYRPFKPKRRTRAAVARRNGLEPLAQLILEQPVGPIKPDKVAAPYLTEEVPTAEAAWSGARDIVAEVIADDADVRARIRGLYQKESHLRVTASAEEKDPKGTYRMYYEFGNHIRYLRPHQILAINRGEAEGVLKVALSEPADKGLAALRYFYPPQNRSALARELGQAAEDAYRRLIQPAMVREARRELTEKASEHAIKVFGTNLRGLLLGRPLRGRTVLALDPGYRTGCKVAILDPMGTVLETGTIYPHAPQRRWDEAKAKIRQWMAKHGVNLIAIGNGTASRETEQLAAKVIDETDEVQYLMVSEAGASVYSAMPLARKELPELDVSIRGAVSIGRRTLDPLAELVKIDPRSIGVGLYQHDVDQKQLTEALDGVVESTVNHVGVNLNTASPSLLQRVAGLGPKTAEAIVNYRQAHGPFENRQELLQVKGVGPRAFEQAAGFLRIPDGDVPLDNTGVHPESYPVVERLMAAIKDTGRRWAAQMSWERLPNLIPEYRSRFKDLGELADWLEVGSMTLADILDELEKPGRDPRDDLPPPILRSDVLSIEDLRPGMKLQGTVRNVVDFGAFVDIGVKQDGLIHVSEMSDKRVRDPYAIISVGDVVEVTVLTVDEDRGRIGLSMRS